MFNTTSSVFSFHFFFLCPSFGGFSCRGASQWIDFFSIYSCATAGTFVSPRSFFHLSFFFLLLVCVCLRHTYVCKYSFRPCFFSPCFLSSVIMLFTLASPLCDNYTSEEGFSKTSQSHSVLFFFLSFKYFLASMYSNIFDGARALANSRVFYQCCACAIRGRKPDDTNQPLKSHVNPPAKSTRRATIHAILLNRAHMTRTVSHISTTFNDETMYYRRKAHTHTHRYPHALARAQRNRIKGKPE